MKILTYRTSWWKRKTLTAPLITLAQRNVPYTELKTEIKPLLLSLLPAKGLSAMQRVGTKGGPAAVIIKNIPERPIPPIPTLMADHAFTFLHDLTIQMIAEYSGYQLKSLFGHPLVFPLTSFTNGKPTLSEPLYAHRDGSIKDPPPVFYMGCLREHKHAPTGLIDIADFVNEFTEEEQSFLCQPDFYHEGHSGSQPLLEISTQGYLHPAMTLLHNSALASIRTKNSAPESQHALEHYLHLLRQNDHITTNVTLEKGDLIAINCRDILHQCLSFPLDQDENQRRLLLRRIALGEREALAA